MVPTPEKRLPLMCERVSAAGRTLWPVEPITANVHPSQSPDKLAHGHGGKAGHLLNYFFWFFPLINQLLLSLSLPFIYFYMFVYFLHWSLRMTFLSLLAILWNSAFKWEYLSFSPLLFASLLFTAICKASSDSHFAFLHFFSMGMVFIPVSCTMSWTSIHSP